MASRNTRTVNDRGTYRGPVDKGSMLLDHRPRSIHMQARERPGMEYEGEARCEDSWRDQKDDASDRRIICPHGTEGRLDGEGEPGRLHAVSYQGRGGGRRLQHSRWTRRVCDLAQGHFSLLYSHVVWAEQSTGK